MSDVTPTAPPGEERPRSAMQRTADAFVWVLGIVAVLFLGRVVLLISPSADLSPFERGQIVGRVAGAIFAGVVVRWVWVKLRRQGRVLSPWILVVATLLLVLALTRP